MKLGQRPPIVCLCGSTRFMDAFRAANLRLTLAGNIVLTVGHDLHGDDQLNIGPDGKNQLDVLHFHKVALADRILVLNVGGYVGESTTREVVFAYQHGKQVDWLEEPPAGARCFRCGERGRYLTQPYGLCDTHETEALTGIRRLLGVKSLDADDPLVVVREFMEFLQPGYDAYRPEMRDWLDRIGRLLAGEKTTP